MPTLIQTALGCPSSPGAEYLQYAVAGVCVRESGCVSVWVCWCVAGVPWMQGAAEYLEYPVADGVIAPPEYAHHWTERLLLLPLPALVKVLVAFFMCLCRGRWPLLT